MRHQIVAACLAACVALGVRAADGQSPLTPTPMDAAVSAGTLPNGVRYFVRHNATPPARAELRLVVDAGSALEDSDQLGMAHFVEHMAFNGSAHFERKALVAYLESIGMRFGADVNASTSTDETIYTLSVPTDSAPLDTALMILTDWANGIRFDSANVVAERKVILEEWRLRSGAGARVALAHDSVLDRDTPYPRRTPIGTVESITTTNPAPLKRYYKDWYRPDLITVVAVGDFDQARMVAAITRRFGKLVAPAHPRPRPVIAPALPTPSATSIVVDSEAGAWSASVLWPRHVTAKPRTIGSFRDNRTAEIFVHIVNARLGQLLQKPGTPLLSAELSTGQLHRGSKVYELAVTTTPRQLEAGLTAAVSELERIARDNVTPGELAQRRALGLRQAVDVADSADKMSSAVLAGLFVQNALSGTITMSHAQTTALLRSTIPAITADEVTAIARAMHADPPVVLASVPQTGPTPATLRDAIAAARTTTLPPYEARLVDAPLVAYPPTPGTITATRSIPSLGVTEWTLSNGVHVLLKPQTGTGVQTVYLVADRPGGTAQAAPADYASAATASLVGAGGVGSYTNEDLQRHYAGVTAGVGTDIRDYDVSVTGEAGVRQEDLELLFELAYLKFTAPRLDTLAFARWKAQAADTTRLDRGALILDDFLRNGRAFGRPVVGRLADSVDARRALTFYRSQFGDATGFTFVVTGAFSLDSIRPLVEQYLGGLPAHSGFMPPAPDTSAHPHAGPIRHLVLTDESDPRSRTSIVYTAPAPCTPENAARIAILGAVLQQRLRETLRTNLGGVYAIDVRGVEERTPYPRVRLIVGYIADPARVEELHRALLADLDSMRTNGPTATELNDAREAARRDYALAAGQPATWAQRILAYATNGWPVDTIVGDEARATRVSADDLRDLARLLLTDDRRIEVLTMPRKFAP